MTNPSTDESKMKFAVHMSIPFPIFTALILLRFTISDLPAGEYDNELSRYAYDIEIQALTLLEANLNVDLFAEQLKLETPIFPTELTQEQVKSKIEEELRMRVEEKFPRSRYDEIKREAEEKYKMYKIGDQVSISRQYGGQQIEVTGLLEVVSPAIVKISGLPVPKIDIDEKDHAQLYWTEHEEAIQKYVRNKTRTFEEERDKFQKQQEKLLARKIWAESGYRRVKKSKGWVPLSEIFFQRYEKERQKKLNQLREEIKEKIYREHEYVYVEEKGGWLPEKVLAVEIAKEKAKEEGGLLGGFKGFFKKKTETAKAATAEEVADDQPVAEDVSKEEQAESAPEGEQTETPPEPKDEDDLWGEEDIPAKPKSPVEKKADKATETIPDKPSETKEPDEKEDVSDLFDEGE
jgi:hypothetical protein